MNKFRRWIHKDRYGVVRGTLLLGIMLLLCTCMLIQLFYSYDIVAEEERASDAVHRVAAQLEQLVDSSLGLMSGAADLIGGGAADEAALMEHMIRFGAFEDAAVLRGSVLTHADGSQSPTEPEEGVSYSADGAEGEIIASRDGKIQLRVPMGQDGMLVGWLRAEEVEVILRSAFDEDYGYAVYNAATGAYLINHTIFENGSYYDALFGLNDDGSAETLLNLGEAQARIERGEAAGGNYYIAQRLMKINSWGVSLVIPEHLVRSEVWSARVMPHATAVAAALMLVILVSYTFFGLRRVRISNENVRQALDMGERMISVATREGRTTEFVYYRGQEALLTCYDGLGLLEDGGSKPRALADLEAACGMDESESGHLRERLRDLKPGENAEVLVRSLVHDREERILRFAICAPSKREQGIICCISDCTQEQASQDRAELERSYQASVQAKASSIWQINISRNRWSVLHSKKRDVLRGTRIAKNEPRDYNADLGGVLRDCLHPADYPAYAEAMSIVGIASAFRAGKTEFVQDYRVRSTDGMNYEWHRMRVRIWLNAKTSDILANLYVFNVDAEKNAELERGERKKVLQQTLTALCGVYYGLYYVDLENNLSYAARSLGGDLVNQFCTPYKATFDEYIDTVVHPDDREALRSMLSAYALRKSMTEGSHFQRREYRRKSGDGYEWAAVIVQPARFENGIVKEVVLAFRYIGRDRSVDRE